RLALADPGNPIELFAQQPLVIARVAHSYANVIVVVPGHEIGFEHFGNLLEGTPELRQRVVGVALQSHLHDHRIGQPNGERIDAHGVALDDAFAFHAVDARPAGRGGKTHALADFLQACACVLLQYHQDREVEFVDRHSEGSYDEEKIILRWRAFAGKEDAFS